MIIIIGGGGNVMRSMEQTYHNITAKPKQIVKLYIQEVEACRYKSNHRVEIYIISQVKNNSSFFHLRIV